MTLRRRIVTTLDRWGKQRLFWGGVILVYAILLVVVVVPMGQRVMRDHREVAAVEQELSDLDAWTVAGMWLAPEVARRQPVVAQAWERTFPRMRDRENLFLEIAKVADGSGLEDFKLREIALARDQAPPRLQAIVDSRMGDGGSVRGVPVVVPRIGLQTYRIKATFKSDYQGVTRFLYGLQGLDRALDLHDLVLRDEERQVKVDLEMDVYVSQIS
ncbi:hypothetical protein GW813_00660 [bacterium]|nr:hypothetical protein [bacterium]PJA76842.1 MAG: hypothetical protein CO151_01505 [bacterium CG_4_9_14_3_um_filter_65_15]